MTETRKDTILACATILSNAGYVAIAEGFHEWTNGTQRAAIDQVGLSDEYTIIYYPPNEASGNTADKAEKLYARITEIEDRHVSLRRVVSERASNAQKQFESIATQLSATNLALDLAHTKYSDCVINMRQIRTTLYQQNIHIRDAHIQIKWLAATCSFLGIVDIGYMTWHFFN